MQAGSAPAASLWSVLVGPGFLLLFTLRHRQKLFGTGMAIQPSASRPPGARALAEAAVAFLTGSASAAASTAQRGRRP